jgi:hypothetical protein
MIARRFGFVNPPDNALLPRPKLYLATKMMPFGHPAVALGPIDDLLPARQSSSQGFFTIDGFLACACLTVACCVIRIRVANDDIARPSVSCILSKRA